MKARKHKRSRPKSATKTKKNRGATGSGKGGVGTASKGAANEEGVTILEMRVGLKRLPVNGNGSNMRERGEGDDGEGKEDEDDEFDPMGGDSNTGNHKYILVLFEDLVHLCHTEMQVLLMKGAENTGVHSPFLQ